MHYIRAYIFIIACIYTPIQSTVSSLGKTHFIIGDPKNFAQTAPPTPSSSLFTPTTAAVYFAPDDNLENLLCNHIANEQSGIDIAIYSFTNKRIAQALLNAKKRGVAIRIITDQYGMNDRSSKLPLLQENTIPVFVYNPLYRGKKSPTLNDVMHNKFVIFKNNHHNRPCVWIGSFNFTHSAVKSNQESVITIQDESVVEKFTTQFKTLLERCKKNSAQH